jgi:hypothetical protein
VLALAAIACLLALIYLPNPSSYLGQRSQSLGNSKFENRNSFAKSLQPSAISRQQQPTWTNPRSPIQHPRLVASYGRLPLSFEANRGQTDGQVKFVSRGRGYTLCLTSNEAVLALRRASQESRVESRKWKGFSGDPLAFRNSKFENRNSPAFNLQSEIFNHPSPVPRTTDASFAPLFPTPYWLLPSSQSPAPSPEPQAPAVVRLKLVGANPAAKVKGLEELPGKSNYFIGNDPKKWRTNVPNYAKVQYKEVYFGVDLVYYGNQRQLEYDFVVAPGGDPRAIKLAVAAMSPSPTGGQRPPLQIDVNGDLVISTDAGDVRLHKPVVYQPTTDNGRPTTDRSFNLQSSIVNHQSVDGRFVLAANNQVTFALSPYDQSLPLIIDPVLAYSSYLGGGGDESMTSCAGVAVDSLGNAYVVSGTTSIDFPTTMDSVQPTYGGAPDPSDWPYACGDAFVSKVDPTGSTLVYSSYLGGTGCDYGSGVAVDSHGNAYVTGTTTSVDFPVTPGALQPTFGGSVCDGWRLCGDAFVTKVGPDGSVLKYSTYLGGSGNDGSDDTIAVDAAGNAYVAGTTDSTDFPTTRGAFQTCFKEGENCWDPIRGPRVPSDVFVTKLNPTGSSLVYSTLIGGSYSETTLALALDPNGNVWVIGTTISSDYPTTAGAFQTSFHPGGGGTPPWTWDWDDAFVTKLNTTGSDLLYSTYLGSLGGECPVAIAVDLSGNAYVTGVTSSADFPITDGAFQPSFSGPLCPGTYEWACSDAFVAKIDPLQAGDASLVYSTFLGGSANDVGAGIAADSFGNAYVTGQTFSTDFPLKNPLQSTNAGAGDAFVTKLDAAGSTLIYSTYLGGANSDLADWLVLDGAGNPYLAGWTESTDFPTTSGVFQPTFGGGARDSFVTKIDSRTFAAEVQPPIEADGSSVFKARRGVVPVKFALAADGAPTCDLYPATIALFRVGGDTPVEVNQSEFIMPSDEGASFRITDCHYHYNLGTSSLGPGAYLVQIKINGSRVGEARFGLK